VFILGVIMKTTYFENLVNKEKYSCKNPNDIRLIDGIEYMRVFKYGTQRECLVRKDSLKKIPESKLHP
jgi:hypothetical protein